jgi:hypothetical protein
MTHSYLLIGILVASAGILSILASRRYGWFVAASGLLAMPAGLADRIFVPEYWMPVHLVGSHLSLEGMLFSFGNGCLIAAIVLQRFPAIRPQPPGALIPPLTRITAVMAVGIAVFLLVWENGAGNLMIMHATFLGFVAMIVFLWRQGNFSPRIAGVGGIGFALCYAAELLVCYGLDPDFFGVWAKRDSYLFMIPMTPGLPAEEMMWAIAYGALWPNLMMYGFRIAPSSQYEVKSP